MPIRDLGPLRVFQFETLQSNGVTHAIFTRRGGVSPPPWATLNLGAGVGDADERVRANRRLVLEALGLNTDSVFDVWQVHSAEVVVADQPRADAAPRRADAILTDRPSVTLLMRFADCVPILLVDPQRRAIGIVHAGWLGTVRQVVRQAVRSMGQAYGSRPEDLRAGLGP
jgi:YfiH family protein